MSIRNAAKGDEGIILGFIKELAEYEKLSHEVVATEEFIAKALFCDNPKAFSLIIEDNGTPIGFALCFYTYSTFTGKFSIYLEDLFIQEAHRNKGLGKAVFKFLAQKAVEEDCSRVDWAVLDWNEPSIAFYKKLGAVPLDDWVSYRLTGDALKNVANGSM